ncbi:hypothetical protein GCM10009771_24670 [Nesterenkonia flava]
MVRTFRASLPRGHEVLAPLKIQAMSSGDIPVGPAGIVRDRAAAAHWGQSDEEREPNDHRDQQVGADPVGQRARSHR